MKAIRNADQERWVKPRFFEGSNYQGVCFKCNSPVEITETFLSFLLKETDEGYIVAPIAEYYCPYCNVKLMPMMFYKNMDVAPFLSQKEESEKP
jgi:hypothetical protein